MNFVIYIGVPFKRKMHTSLEAGGLPGNSLFILLNEGKTTYILPSPDPALCGIYWVSIAVSSINFLIPTHLRLPVPTIPRADIFGRGFVTRHGAYYNGGHAEDYGGEDHAAGGDNSDNLDSTKNSDVSGDDAGKDANWNLCYETRLPLFLAKHPKEAGNEFKKWRKSQKPSMETFFSSLKSS